MVLNSNLKLKLTAVVLLYVIGFILFEFFNGGVSSHYILHDKDMPSISNWWSLLSMPLATWVVLALMSRKPVISAKQIYVFVGGLVFGVLVTILFNYSPDIINYVLYVTFAMALFLNLCTPEYYLGFVLSMMLGFGGVLPVMFGLIFIGIYGFEYFLFRGAFLKIKSKF
ncbi:hypothetical protein [Fulvivirga lutimaris]|uniref:hypothetical protein n=1 Tax=Fulvivirga lutimaris TaxID=1819566 RepID=UPI0012BD2154|nr:hypothetical protein [Fulvivirga lutimaris]MTI40790.1 hypothetical protein [Fulvivirga lutimaris]